MNRAFARLLSAGLSAAFAAVPPFVPHAASSVHRPAPAIEAIDLYRSNALTLPEARAAVAPLLKRYAANPNDNPDEQEALEKRLKRKLLTLGHFAFARATLSIYRTSSGLKPYLTLDVVDPEDALRRLAFKAPPRGRPNAAAKLAGAWRRYESLGRAQLRREGEPDERPACPAYFCRWRDDTSEMSRLDSLFHSSAPVLAEALAQTALLDADANSRAAALHLIAYLADASRVVSIETEALRDPAPEARGAALDVLSDIAWYHPNVPIDWRQTVPAVDDPWVTNRSKGLSVLLALAKDKRARPEIARALAPYLPSLIRVQEPGNHDLAYALATLVSGKFYPPDDDAAWEAWFSALEAGTRKN